MELVIHRSDVRLGGTNFVSSRIVLILGAQLANSTVEGCRVEQYLAVTRHFVEQP